MHPERENKPEQFGGGPLTVFNALLWGALLLSLPLLYMRIWRGRRANSLPTRVLAFALFPVVVAAGGGYTTPLIYLPVCGFLFMAMFAAQGEKLAARHGYQVSSRFIGFPLFLAFLPQLKRWGYWIEPFTWLLVAGGFWLLDQDGIAVAFALGAVLMPHEYLIVCRHESTDLLDLQDARVEALARARMLNNDHH